MDGHGGDGHGEDGHGVDEQGEDGHGVDEHGVDEHGGDEQGEDEQAEDGQGEDGHGVDKHGEDRMVEMSMAGTYIGKQTVTIIVTFCFPSRYGILKKCTSKQDRKEAGYTKATEVSGVTFHFISY